MSSSLRLLAALAAVAVAVPALALAARPAKTAGPRQAHMVFFTLKDHSPAAREKFLASCQKYLTGHPGTLYYSVGTIAEDVVEDPSVRDFDVALHLVFEDKQAGERYQKSERHVAFVKENRESFAKVRVFDSYLAPEAK